jgi:murein DD-endopeptidase MepM/ murein hydrolase activator NlpD
VGLFLGGLLVGGFFITSSPVITHEDKNELKIASVEFTDRVKNNDSTKAHQINNIVDDADIAPQDAGTFAIKNALNSQTDEIFTKEIRIKRGEGLMDVLMNNGTSRQDAFNAIKALRTVFNVRKIQVGQRLNITHKTSGDLDRLEMQKDFDNLIVIENNANKFEATLQTLETQVITRHSTGIIDDSLFLAAQKQGLPQSVIIELIRIFSYDVDFQREIRKGDQFEIFYERKLSVDGQQVQEGDILFAKLTLSGKEINLYRHKPNGEDFADYFHEDGQSSKKALMKTPIEGARLSSNYGQRKHPVLGYTRMHKGVDFSAPTGTPIMAAGDGVVERASWYGSFGNYVRIRHNGTYKTIYAHMSKYGKGIKQGTRVRQGQIIGYVGATGRVTGRHLHYEVYMNGAQVNPLSLKIPSGIKLAGRPFEDYKLAMLDMDQKITQAKSHILLVNTDIATISNEMAENTH